MNEFATRYSWGDLFRFIASGERERVEKPWGWMHEIRNERGNLIVKLIRVNEGQKTSLQVHRKKEEVLTILEGRGYIELPHSVGTIRHGSVRLAPGVLHRCVGPLLMLEVSTYHPDDVVRIEDDYGRT